jgi:iron complex outermembrane receptor protein
VQYGETRNTFDVDFLYHLKLGSRQIVLWGAGARVSPSHFVQTIPGLNFTANNQTDSIYSGFVQDEIQIVKQKLSLTLGSKFEHNSFDGFDAQPSARLLWTPRPRQTFWAAVTRAVRTPSRLDTDVELFEFLGDLPKTTVPAYLEVTGDPTFDSEELLGYEAGYRTLITSKFYVDFSAFDNQYDDLASYGKGTGSLQTKPITYFLLAEPYANGIKGSTEGFEIAPKWNPTSWWQLKGSYSYLHLSTEDKPGYTDTGTVAIYNGSSPHSGIVIQSLFNLPKRFEYDMTYRYVSALPAQAVQAYSTADVRVGWHTGDFEFSVDGQNLFQPEHGEFGNTPGPVVGIGRTVYAKVTWTHEGH